jgi:hypothetical protein
VTGLDLGSSGTYEGFLRMWELLAVLLVMVTVKLSMMVWYKFHD